MQRIEPVASFTSPDEALITLFPSYFGGHVIVKGTILANGSAQITHSCQLCKIFQQRCPYISSHLWYLSVFQQRGFSLFEWQKKAVSFEMAWTQIATPTLVRKDESHEYFAKHY